MYSIVRVSKSCKINIVQSNLLLSQYTKIGQNTRKIGDFLIGVSGNVTEAWSCMPFGRARGCVYGARLMTHPCTDPIAKRVENWEFYFFVRCTYTRTFASDYFTPQAPITADKSPSQTRQVTVSTKR